MIDVLEKEYWSKADAFLLPLTGLAMENVYNVKSYLYWKEYSIENYNLILVFEYDDYEEFMSYSRTVLFPLLDKKSPVIETFDIEGKSIFILDISEWAMDIEMLLAGKYSKFSKQMKLKIETFHMFEPHKVPVQIFSVLYPFKEQRIFNGKSSIEYVAENYDFNIELLRGIGELGSICIQEHETLSLEPSELCQNET